MSLLIQDAAGPESRILFGAILLAVALERMWELLLSRRNVRAAMARGGMEAGRRLYPWMVTLHGSFLVSCVLEILLTEPPFYPLLAGLALSGVAGTMFLRYWAVVTLGERWSTRVIFIPGEPMVRRGPYRFLRHPNYVAVALEIVFLPLIHSAWRTALIFGGLNLILLAIRILWEERALTKASDYGEALGSLPRFLPRPKGKSDAP